MRTLLSLFCFQYRHYSLVASGGGISSPIWLSGWATQESINQIDSPSNSSVCSLDLMRTSVKIHFFLCNNDSSSSQVQFQSELWYLTGSNHCLSLQKNGRSGSIRGGVASRLRNTIYCFSLTRKENTSMLPLANQRPSTSGTPRPLGYMKESALDSSGHWHNKDSGSARRINFFFDFSLYFLRRNNGRYTSWLWFGYLCQGKPSAPLLVELLGFNLHFHEPVRVLARALGFHGPGESLRAFLTQFGPGFCVNTTELVRASWSGFPRSAACHCPEESSAETVRARGSFVYERLGSWSRSRSSTRSMSALSVNSRAVGTSTPQICLFQMNPRTNRSAPPPPPTPRATVSGQRLCGAVRLIPFE